MSAVSGNVGNLVSAVRDLFDSQVESWPDLARGLDGLRRARERAFEVDGFGIIARHLPHRIRSTTAPVDAESVSGRPCFLCPGNRPVEQRGIATGDFDVFCNPYPILETHLTIVCREHTPQRIHTRSAERGIDRMLDLARALPGLMVLYNGPFSGASAPDHLHFQAASIIGVPVFDENVEIEDGTISRYPGSVIAISGGDPGSVARRMRRVIERLPRPSDAVEPMLNVAVAFHDGSFRVRLFPRARHRPGVFERGELTWSPGAIDMCGMVVLPVAGDLERLTVEVIRSTYREVSLAPDAVRRVTGGLDEHPAG